jgi:Flp pilus assembly protein TadG
MILEGRREEMSRGARARGQVLVELALLTPLLLLVVVGLIHLGWALSTHQILTNAAREGARAGTRAGATEASMRAVVLDVCHTAGLDTTEVTVEATPGAPNVPSSVTVSYAFHSPLDALFARLFGGAGVIVRAQCVMKY